MKTFVAQFKTPAELAEALLTETGVYTPAHRGEGSMFYAGSWQQEKRYDLDYLAERIPEKTLQHIASWAMRDLTEAGRLMRNALQHVAAETARDLFNDWCTEERVA